MTEERCKRESGKHCEHLSDQQHAIYVENGIHRDYKCCWCGRTRCDVVYFPIASGAHGPYATPKLKTRPTPSMGG